jgi:hypothetical protein
MRDGLANDIATLREMETLEPAATRVGSSLASLRARIARRPGRWRVRMSADRTWQDDPTPELRQAA